MRPLAKTMVGLSTLTVISAALASACSGDFDPVSAVNSVRILAVAADKPYAAPGDTVTLSLLAYDARPTQPSPMVLSWFPFVCIDPPGDEYYACYSPVPTDGGASAVSPDGGAIPSGISGFSGNVPPGTNLTPFLPQGPTFSFVMPSDIIDKHKQTPGVTPNYGLAIAFNVACAGNIQLLPLDPTQAGGIQMPVGCFDSDGNALGADDYMVGIARVFAYADGSVPPNKNPSITSITQDPPAIPGSNYPDVISPPPNAASATGFVMPHCTANLRASCPEYKINVILDPASWELTQETDSNGNRLHEQLWVDYYTTIGQFEGDAELLYDPLAGVITDSPIKYQPPDDPGDGIIWAVVHDNRGGAAWQQISLHVQ